VLLNGVFGVQNLWEVEGYLDVNVGRSSWVLSNVFKEEFRFCKVETLLVDELHIWIRKHLALAHFEKTVDDEDKFWEIGGKKFCQ